METQVWLVMKASPYTVDGIFKGADTFSDHIYKYIPTFWSLRVRCTMR